MRIENQLVDKVISHWGPDVDFIGKIFPYSKDEAIWNEVIGAQEKQIRGLENVNNMFSMKIESKGFTRISFKRNDFERFPST